LKCKKNIVRDENGERIYLNDNDNSYLIEFKDEITIEGNKKIRLRGLGQKFSSINSFFFDYLNAYNIPTGYKKSENGLMVFQKHNRLPFTVRVFNVVDKRIARLFNKKEGEALTLPIFEFLYGTAKDNLITESHLISLDVCPLEDIKLIKRICSKVNAVLRSYFERRNTILAEVKCYFGKDEDKIFIINDFTPKSLKVFSAVPDNKIINPYKIKSPADFKSYIDFVLNLTRN